MMFPVTFDVTKHPLQGDECAVLVLSFLPKTFTDLLLTQQYLYEHFIPLNTNNNLKFISFHKY